VLHNFTLAGRPLRLWKDTGESYEHVLMKALGFAMFVETHPRLQVELRVGMRYKPDLVSLSADGAIEFWGECGLNTTRKTAWILKHAGAKRLVLFKIGQNSGQISRQLRDAIPEKYRTAGRLRLVNFIPEIRDLTATKQIATVSSDWFETVVI
jgi:hypothetical protein